MTLDVYISLAYFWVAYGGIGLNALLSGTYGANQNGKGDYDDAYSNA